MPKEIEKEKGKNHLKLDFYLQNQGKHKRKISKNLIRVKMKHYIYFAETRKATCEINNITHA